MGIKINVRTIRINKCDLLEKSSMNKMKQTNGSKDVACQKERD